MQRRVIAATEPFARDIEIYSIDENFLDLSRFEHLVLVERCQKLRANTLRWTIIPTCVGIGATKTLAKLGNAAAKKNPNFHGVADLSDEHISRYVMDRIEVADVWGVGAATTRKLAGLGILTARELRDMTSDSFELIAAARAAVERAYRDGYEYTKAGVMLEQLVSEESRPRTLFEDVEGRERKVRLMHALDQINGKFGRMTAVPGSQGFERPWKMRADMKSPAWTTRIDELPIVNATS